jgi:transposase
VGINFSETDLDRLYVLRNVLSGQQSRREAAHELGICPRQLRRLLVRFKAEGSSGIKPRYHGGNHKFSEDFKTQVMFLVQTKYPDFGPVLAKEKLEEIHDLRINKETLRQWMIEAGLRPAKKRKAARIHQCRPRRSRLGELVQIDGSHHDWFEGRAPKCCLTVFIDDATSRIQSMRFDHSETTQGYFRCLNNYLNHYGRPRAFYSDRHSIFKTTRETCEEVRFKKTQFHRAANELDIELICARSPQAKGRVERANKTLQDRLIKEMRLKGISCMAEANVYLDEFILKHNRKFSLHDKTIENTHRPLHQTQEKLNRILSIQTNRKLSKNLEFSYENTLYQIQGQGHGYRLRHTEVTVCENMDESIEVFRGEQQLQYVCRAKSVGPHVSDEKGLDEILERKVLLSWNSLGASL